MSRHLCVIMIKFKESPQRFQCFFVFFSHIRAEQIDPNTPQSDGPQHGDKFTVGLCTKKEVSISSNVIFS